MRKLVWSIVMVALTVLPLAAAPASATGTTTPPAACGKRPPVLAENEVFVEHKLYLHSATPVAETQQVPRMALGNPPTGLPTMDANAPTSPVSHVDLIANPNDAFNRNGLAAYWTYNVPAAQRIVCGEATFFGAGMDTATIQLFVDQPYGTTNVTLTSSGTASPAGEGDIREFSGALAKLDVVAESDLTFQIVNLSGAVLFDSTAHPSSFTYYTIETVEP